MRAEILVVDDQAGPRESLRIILKDTHNVRVAADGPEALVMIEELEPDLVFLDVRMPGMDGVEVLEVIKEKHPDVQVAMITAYAAVETAQSAIRLGATDYITKPFSVPDVEDVVRRALNQRRSHREERLLELQLREIREALTDGAGLSGDLDALDRTAIVAGLTTAHQSMQAQVSHLSRLNALGEIAAEVNHDLNNLLSTIMLTIELLLKRTEMGEEVDLAELSDALRTIEAAAQEGSSATSRIREFLRSDPYAPREMVDLYEVVSSSLELSSGRVAGFESRHEMRNELPHLPKIFGNAAALRAALTNILINARQALAESGGVVTVTGWQDGDHVVIRTEDNGVGMTPDVLAQATTAFFTTKSEDGTGLGLSLANKLITQHGGSLHLESEPGKGTKVDIRLPLVATSEPDVGGADRVLVVDDDERALSLICQLLRASGFETVAASSGEAAWNEFTIRQGLDDEQISVILTDLDMPGITGTELARRVKQSEPDLPVILLTGVRGAEASLGPDGQYLDAVIYKPFNVNNLIEALRGVAPRAV